MEHHLANTYLKEPEIERKTKIMLDCLGVVFLKGSSKAIQQPNGKIISSKAIACE